MQSSFNVIKNSRVITQGSTEINTQLNEVTLEMLVDENPGIRSEDMKSYENIARNILDNARRESELIISKAYIDAELVKTQASEAGYNEGYESGYSEAIQRAVDAAQVIRTEADDLLISARHQYNKYLVDKEKHIKALIVNIAQSILKKEVNQPDALNEMVFNTLKAERNIKAYIIKINNSHFDAIRDEVENFKTKLAFQGDIFVIEDNLLDEGTAVIEKESGKSIVSIAYGIEKIVEIFQEEQI